MRGTLLGRSDETRTEARQGHCRWLPGKMPRHRLDPSERDVRFIRGFLLGLGTVPSALTSLRKQLKIFMPSPQIKVRLADSSFFFFFFLSLRTSMKRLTHLTQKRGGAGERKTRTTANFHLDVCNVDFLKMLRGSRANVEKTQTAAPTLQDFFCFFLRRLLRSETNVSALRPSHHLFAFQRPGFSDSCTPIVQ